MRAVNLLPPDLRGAAAKVAAAAPRVKAEGIGAYVVLGALALCVAALAAYVMTTNTVKQKQTDLAQVTAEADAAAREVTRLKPYADFEAMANARVETVRGLAAARFDWEQALRELALAMPADIKLQGLNGDMGLPGAAAAGGSDPLRGSIQAPAITLTGCAADQPGVARMMARLRGVQGVTRVSLSKSEKADSDATTSACTGANPPSFSVVVFFERSAAMAAMAPAEANAATGPGVPVPNAVSGTPSGTDGAPAAGADGQAAAAGEGTSTTTPTSTTPTGADAP
jgi:Tfp pilus assembly protein PilN